MIRNLPSISYDQKARLPYKPGVYFVVDSDDTVVYVGKSRDIRMRWLNHELRGRVKNGNYTIRWMEVPIHKLDSTEQVFIDQYRPAWNKTPRRYGPRLGSHYVSIDEDTDIAIDRVARELSTSRSAVVREAVNLLIKQQEKDDDTAE